MVKTITFPAEGASDRASRRDFDHHGQTEQAQRAQERQHDDDDEIGQVPDEPPTARICQVEPR